jgi:DNA-binding GntR family transcriptional regulator
MHCDPDAVRDVLGSRRAVAAGRVAQGPRLELRTVPRQDAMEVDEQMPKAVEDAGPGKTKADLIAERLRKDIAAGRIARGARLQQDQLAAQFNTSITPVREALRQLLAEGLLDGQPRRGVSVAEPNLEQIGSISVMRRLVEPYAARRASARLTRLDFERARAINAELAAQGRSDQELHFRRLNQDFHFLIYRACGLPTLVLEIERLWAAFPWASLQLRKGRASESATEHEAMLQAVVDDDQDAIQRRFEEHVHNGYLALVEQLGAGTTEDPFAPYGASIDRGD